MKYLAFLKYKAYKGILNTFANIIRLLENKRFDALLCITKRLLHIVHIYYYKIIPSQECLGKTIESRYIIENPRKGYYGNLVFGCDYKNDTLLAGQLPDVHIDVYREVDVIGQSQYVYDSKHDVLINDFAALFDENLYENVDTLARFQKGRVALLKTNIKEPKLYYPKAIMLISNFSFNYYHALFENYIKLLAFDKLNIPTSVPILVDAIYEKYTSFQEILRSLNNKGRKVLLIRRKEHVRIGQLYMASAINMIPPQAKDILKTNPWDVLYDLNYLQSLRNCLLPLKSNKVFNKRVFISRKGLVRRSWNEEDVFNYLKDHGFEQYSPQDLSFADQVALFYNAEFIVAGSGAALSNLLFCNDGCKVLCLYSEKINLPVFSTLAYLNGTFMKYYIGTPQKGSSVTNTHSSFHVDIEDFKRVFSVFENE